MVDMLYKIFAEVTWILVGFLLGGMFAFAKSGGDMRGYFPSWITDIIIYGPIFAILNGIVAATLLSYGFESRVRTMVGLNGTIALLMFLFSSSIEAAFLMASKERSDARRKRRWYS